MKKTSTIMMLLYSMVTSAQVSIGNVQVETPAIQQSKPPVYDSLSNFLVQTDPQNYIQYVGYQFYLPPKKENSNSVEPLLHSIHSVINTEDVYDKYYTLIKGVTGATLKAALVDGKLYDYHKETFIQLNKYPYFLKPIYFVMKNNKNGDTLLWAPNENDFIFVPYFVKQKALYENKTFVYIGGISDNDREKNSKWVCKEVTLLKEYQYAICYVLVNDKNETIIKKANPFYPEIRDNKADYHLKCFITEKEFIKQEQENKQKEQALKAQNQAAIAKHNEKEKAKYQEWVKDYGKENADLLANGKVRIGMTREMCIYAWGPIFKSYKTVNDQGNFETYRYSLTQALYFENGILKQIEQ